MAETTKLVIGYDGSANAELVIEDLKWAGLPPNVDATVLSAADVFLPPPPDASTPAQIRPIIERSRERSQEALRVAQSLSEHGAREIKKMFPKWTVHSEAVADSPAWAIVKKAEESKPALVVVGAHGHSQIGRFIGSISQMVIVHSSYSVRVARRRLDPTSGKLKIVVGVDGSSDGEAAVDAVANRSWPPQTEVFLVSVIDPKNPTLLARLTPSVIRWFLEQGDDERTVVGRMLESYAKKLREHGVVVTSLIETGDPKRILVEQAETRRADSLFIGARGLGNLKRFVIGGVSAAVSARAHCSVEVIRHPAK